jgi:hypothetical protein
VQYSVTKNSNAIADIPWIEKLLQTPLADRRKYCMWKILAPYLINRRKLSYDHAYAVMTSWLQECNKLQRLQFNASLKIKNNLNSAIKTGYYPAGLAKINSTVPEFYNFLQKHGVV